MSVADFLYYAGGIAIITGVAMMHVPSACVVGGMMACAAAYLLQGLKDSTPEPTDGKETQ